MGSSSSTAVTAARSSVVRGARPTLKSARASRYCIFSALLYLLGVLPAMIFPFLVVAVAATFSAHVLADPGAIPANIPLAFDALTRRYIASVVMVRAYQPVTACFDMRAGCTRQAADRWLYHLYGHALFRCRVQQLPCIRTGQDTSLRPQAVFHFPICRRDSCKSVWRLGPRRGIGPRGLRAEADNTGRRTLELAQPDTYALSVHGSSLLTCPTVVLSNASESALSLFSDKVTGVMGLATSPPNGGSAVDSVLGHWFQIHTPNTTFEYGMALDDISSTIAQQQGLADDGAAGHLHMLAPNTTFFDPDQLVWSSASSALIGAAPGASSTSNSFTSDFAFTLQGWSFNGPDSFVIASGEAAQATFEPLFPSLIFPAKYAIPIYASIPGAQLIPSSDPMQWTLPCSTTSISWSPTFNSLQLPMTNLVQRVGDSCVGAIEGWTDQSVTTYLLGSAFMSNAYM